MRAGPPLASEEASLGLPKGDVRPRQVHQRATNPVEDPRDHEDDPKDHLPHHVEDRVLGVAGDGSDEAHASEHQDRVLQKLHEARVLSTFEPPHPDGGKRTCTGAGRPCTDECRTAQSAHRAGGGEELPSAERLNSARAAPAHDMVGLRKAQSAPLLRQVGRGARHVKT